MLGFVSLNVLLSLIQLSQAVNVYLHPQNNVFRSTLSVEDASLVLSQHLGLDMFETMGDSASLPESFDEVPFVGQGSKNALLLTLEEADAQVVLPTSLNSSFKLSAPKDTPISSLSSIISTYTHRASLVYSSIFSPSSLFTYESSSLSSFFEDAQESAFAALDLSSLAELRESHGSASEEYTSAAGKARALIQTALAQSETIQLAVLSYSPPPSHSHSKRQANPLQSQAPLPPNHPRPQEPHGSISTCFATADACNNGTSTCSGRGQCVEASKAERTCFVCTCGVTKTGEGNSVKTEYWVGESCERKDVSGPFVLLTGTVIVLILVVFGSVSLLYTIGDQALPSVLMGGVVNKKD